MVSVKGHVGCTVSDKLLLVQTRLASRALLPLRVWSLGSTAVQKHLCVEGLPVLRLCANREEQRREQDACTSGEWANCRLWGVRKVTAARLGKQHLSSIAPWPQEAPAERRHQESLIRVW